MTFCSPPSSKLEIEIELTDEKGQPETVGIETYMYMYKNNEWVSFSDMGEENCRQARMRFCLFIYIIYMYKSPTCYEGGKKKGKNGKDKK